MQVNTTIVVALITAIAAIIAPLINSFMNNRTQLKLKRLDLFYKEKSDIYQNFCKAIIDLDNWIYTEDDDARLNPPSKEFLKIHQLTYLMANTEIRSLLDELNSYYYLGEIKEKEIKTILMDVIQAMNEDLEKFRR
ncbi:hypothetical protein [Clostridium manihotivorum]|uniref:Uncharacterized protein n=1 Tax=Clostridium manihotivorum TaxID=2320868 RepID=A0A3R5QRU3_9CLOT|nr:hypothetical protein [Clostridium manihotivorum]QAA31230.1 hypothetical protein C1I91_05985 [Clostridium manihotivorum]